MDWHADLLFEVELHNTVSLGKDDGVAFSTNWVVFEDEVHADTLKIFHVCDSDWSSSNMGEFFVNAFSIGPLCRRFLENEQLVRLLSIFDQILTRNDTEHPLIRTDIHRDDLIPLPGLRRKQVDLDFPMFDFLPGFWVEHLDLVHIWDQNAVHTFYVYTDAALVVLLWHADLEIMGEFSGNDTKIFLIGLECDTILDCRPKHHLGALHEVVHTVLEVRHEILWVNEVEVNLLSCGYLDPFVTFDKVDEASLWDCVVLLPSDFAGDLILNLFEEEDLAWTSGDEGFVVE